MLHFEMYGEPERVHTRWGEKDMLTHQNGPVKYKYVPQASYERRDDLLDPTSYLDEWWMTYKKQHGRGMDLTLTDKLE